MKISLVTLLFAGLAIGLVGCKGGDSAAGGEKKLTIAVIPKGSTHEFWKSVHEGTNKAAEELGVEVIFKGPVKEDDRESQIKTVEDFITKRVDGIVLAPLDKTALKGVVKEANEANIPVVIIDSPLDGATSLVATDNEKGGNMAGEECVKVLTSAPYDKMTRKRKVVVLRYQEGSASTMLREKGFIDVLEKNPNIEIVSKNQYGGATADSAQKAGENLLSSFKKPDGSLDVDAIFTPNESTTFGMLRVLQEANWAGKVKFFGFDSAPKLLDALRAGQIESLVVQNPRNMGYSGVKTIVADIKAKKDPSDKVDTGAALITKANIDSEENKALLAPPKG